MLFLPDRLNLKSVLSSYHHQAVLQVNLNQHCSSDRILVCFWSVGFSKVCDANSRWYLADSGLDPGVVLLLTGRSLSHGTSCYRRAASYRAASDFSSSAITAASYGAASDFSSSAISAASYRAASDFSSSAITAGRTSVAFKLMPQGNAILECSPISAAGH